MGVRLNPGTPQQSKRSLQLDTSSHSAPDFQSSFPLDLPTPTGHAYTPLNVPHRNVFSSVPVDSKITTQL